jgi:hypothetical protein
MASHPKSPRSVLARIAVVVSAGGLMLGLGVAPAFADPGNGNGNANPPGNANGLTNGNGGGNGNASTHQTEGTGGTRGDVTQAQPPSNADFSGNGANVHGAYDSTRDGSPSMNGNGNGNAVGKPCAGCVGAADNKNPPGQFPNGTDLNAGYECDTNHGIGRTNPAHTGCQVVPPTPPVPETPPEVTPPPKVPERPPVKLVSAPTPVSIPSVSIPSVSIPSVSSPVHALPVTGSSVLVTLALGLAALAVGGAMTVFARLRLTKA